MSSSAAEIQREIEAQLVLHREEERRAVKEKAKKVAEYARSIAPVYHGPPRPDVQPGEFRDSIINEDAPDYNGRPAARVVSHSRIAHLLEYGTSKMPALAVFARTAEHFNGTPDGTSVEYEH